MKLIIDISEEFYDWCKEWVVDECANIEQAIIAEGTPLPKGHGDLIDKSKIHKAISATEDNCTGMGMSLDEMDAYNEGIDSMYSLVQGALPIIEADDYRRMANDERRQRRMNNDLISRSELKKVFGYTDEWYKGRTICELIDNAPTVFDCRSCKNNGNERECVDCHDYSNYVHYENRQQGEWNYIQAEMCVCPFCGAYPHKDYKNFCPNCGADMRKGGVE